MLELEGITHRFIARTRRELSITTALKDVSLFVDDGEFVAVVGPSGSGKSTLLRIVAGLVEPEHGEVRVNGAPVDGPGRDRSLVFQDGGLFPWQSAAGNIVLALELAGMARGRRAATIADEQLSTLGLASFERHYPHQLSGGMQQRVALARALVLDPVMLLMDEPFGALDAILRRRAGEYLVSVWEAAPRTVIFVTHSIDEALTLADRVVVIRAGGVVRDELVAIDRPRDVDAVQAEPRFQALRQELWGEL